MKLVTEELPKVSAICVVCRDSGPFLATVRYKDALVNDDGAQLYWAVFNMDSYFTFEILAENEDEWKYLTKR